MTGPTSAGWIGGDETELRRERTKSGRGGEGEGSSAMCECFRDGGDRETFVSMIICGKWWIWVCMSVFRFCRSWWILYQGVRYAIPGCMYRTHAALEAKELHQVSAISHQPRISLTCSLQSMTTHCSLLFCAGSSGASFRYSGSNA